MTAPRHGRRFLPETRIALARAAGASEGDAPLGVLLVNLGTPDAPEPAAIRRFLKEFLSDPRVVELPRAVWWPLLNGVILNVRPRRIRDKYASVWMTEGSPLLVYSRRQATALQHALTARGVPAVVELGMRYGQPSLPGAIDALRERGVRRILTLPLYPQYAASTTATVVDRVAAHAARLRDQPELRFVQRFCDDAGYIAALAARVRSGWAEQGRGERLLLSFHGLPRSSISLGDPYYAECMRTGSLLAQALGLDETEVLVTFQSRFGAAEWLQPYTEPTLQRLAREGIAEVDVFCPGFVADCLETLEEIAQGAAETFTQAGGKRLRYLPALNDDAVWIAALAAIAERNLLGWWEHRVEPSKEDDMSRPTSPPSQSDTQSSRETELDEAIEDTFPASDPVAAPSTRPAKTSKPSQEDQVEHDLDEALEDTFPASDPLPLTDPDAKKDKR